MTQTPNPFDLLNAKLDDIKQQLNELMNRPIIQQRPARIPFRIFCKEHNITPPTGYVWIKKGIIKSEMLGNRRFVIESKH